MIIYISGPISGVEDYAERFREEELRLTSEGHVVLNPAALPVGMGNHEKYMRICMAMLDEADAISMLPGWEKSRGANREYGYALAKNLVIFEFEEGEKWLTGLV